MTEGFVLCLMTVSQVEKEWQNLTLVDCNAQFACLLLGTFARSLFHCGGLSDSYFAFDNSAVPGQLAIGNAPRKRHR
jgi:hypothetical protein